MYVLLSLLKFYHFVSVLCSPVLNEGGDCVLAVLIIVSMFMVYLIATAVILVTKQFFKILACTKQRPNCICPYGCTYCLVLIASPKGIELHSSVNFTIHTSEKP